MECKNLVGCEEMGGDLELWRLREPLDTRLLEGVCYNWLLQLIIPSVGAIGQFKWYELGGVRR